MQWPLAFPPVFMEPPSGIPSSFTPYCTRTVSWKTQAPSFSWPLIFHMPISFVANAEYFLVARIHGALAAPIAHDLRMGDVRFLGIHHSAVGHDDRWSLVLFEFGPVLQLSDWNCFLVRSEKFCVWRRENIGLTSN